MKEPFNASKKRYNLQCPADNQQWASVLKMAIYQLSTDTFKKHPKMAGPGRFFSVKWVSQAARLVISLKSLEWELSWNQHFLDGHSSET